MDIHRLPNRDVRKNYDARMIRRHQAPAWRANGEGMSKCVRYCRILLALFLINPSAIFASIKESRPAQLGGYKAVRVYYGRLNKMIMPVHINGQPANLLVDTGASHVMLDADAAASFGIRPSQRGLRYIRFSEINGQELPLGFAQNLTAGSMSFGSILVTLSSSRYSSAGNAHIDGVLGLDILSRYKAVINCRTKLVFFKADQARQMHLSSVASAEKFARIPVRREESGALTVPCSVHGQPARLLVDTGAFITTFDEAFLKPLGVPLEATGVSAHFARGTARKIRAGKINDLQIGHFKISPAKFGVTALPNFALQQGRTTISGILGIDTLYNYNAIIDLDGMNLFLK
jgi:predicted aspartyl protease